MEQWLSVTRKTIPNIVYDSWNVQIQVVGSDSDIKVYSLDEKDTDADTISDGSDFDKNLTSSMYDMDISSEDRRGKGKGKGKEVVKKDHSDATLPPQSSKA